MRFSGWQLIIGIALLCIFHVTKVWSATDRDDRCTGQDFHSINYFLDIDSIAAVSTFFYRIPDTYFSQENALFFVLKGSRNRTEIYYDDRERSLLKSHKELLFIKNNKLPVYRAGREQVVFKSLDSASQNYFEFEVKDYNRKNTQLDKHALFGKVKRKQRELLIDEVKAVTDAPINQITGNFKVEHHEIVQLLRHYGESYAEITLDSFHISDYGLPNTNSILKFEIYPEKPNSLKQNEKEYINRMFCQANADFKALFPGIPAFSHFGYSHYEQIAQALFPARSFFKRYPVLFKLSQILVISSCGFLFIYLLIGRYSMRQSYRSVMTPGRQGQHDD